MEREVKIEEFVCCDGTSYYCGDAYSGGSLIESAYKKVGKYVAFTFRYIPGQHSHIEMIIERKERTNKELNKIALKILKKGLLKNWPKEDKLEFILQKAHS